MSALSDMTITKKTSRRNNDLFLNFLILKSSGVAFFSRFMYSNIPKICVFSLIFLALINLPDEINKINIPKPSHTIRAASHYTILSLRRPAMPPPHDAIADRTSCNVRPSAILSAAILTIGGYRRPS